MAAKKSGFTIEIEFHTEQAGITLSHPEKLRMIVGAALDELGIQEEIDFTLSVSRNHVFELKEKPTKKDCDPRCKSVTAKIFEAYKSSNKVNPPWGIIEGKQLKEFLSSHLEWSEKKIFDCIRNRWRSDENLALEPRRWITRIGDFAAGPLDKYGKPKVGGSPLVMQNGTGRKPHLLDGMPGPEELAAQRLKENARIPRMPDEKFL